MREPEFHFCDRLSETALRRREGRGGRTQKERGLRRGKDSGGERRGLRRREDWKGERTHGFSDFSVLVQLRWASGKAEHH